MHVAEIIYRTDGSFLAMKNSAGDYALIDYIELGKLRDFLHDPAIPDDEPGGPVLSEEIWESDRMPSAPRLRLESREQRWALEREDGRLFASLTDVDITTIRQARGW